MIIISYIVFVDTQNTTGSIYIDGKFYLHIGFNSMNGKRSLSLNVDLERILILSCLLGRSSYPKVLRYHIYKKYERSENLHYDK